MKKRDAIAVLAGVSLATAALLFSGGALGKRVSEAARDEIKPGQTMAEVVARFGEPNRLVQWRTGVRTMFYDTDTSPGYTDATLHVDIGPDDKVIGTDVQQSGPDSNWSDNGR